MQLKDVCKINMGQSPDSSSYNENGDGIPFYQGNADFGERHPVTRIWCNSPKKIADTGDILISVRAPIGALNFANEKCCIGRGLAAITPNRKIVSSDYVFWMLKGKNDELNRKGTGSTFKAIGRKALEEIAIPNINLETQNKYAETLEKVYAVMQARKHELQTLDELIKARFVEMFGNQSNNEKGFTYGKIADVADIYLGLTHTPKYIERGVKFISAKNISADYLDLSEVKYISAEEYASAPEGAKPRRGDMLFSRVGSNLGHPVIIDIDEELCTFVSLGFLRSKDSITTLYLKHWMRDSFFAEQVKRKVIGGGQPNLNTGWLKEFSIIIPPITLQNEFAEFVQEVDKSKVVV